jgi:hypothetical protein
MHNITGDANPKQHFKLKLVFLFIFDKMLFPYLSQPQSTLTIELILKGNSSLKIIEKNI